MRMIDCIRLIVQPEDSGGQSLNMDIPPIAALWVGPLPFVIVNTPEAVEIVLGNPNNLNKSLIYRMFYPWLGTGLLTSGGRKWRYHRKLLTPAFHFRILEQFIPIMNKTAANLINVMRKEVGEDGVLNDIRGIILRCTLDIICETAMGEKINALKDPEGEYFKAVDEMTTIIVNRVWRPWLYLDFIFRLTKDGKNMYKNIETMHAFTNRVIESRKKVLLEQLDNNQNIETKSDQCRREEGMKKREPFMDTLIREHIRDPTRLTMKHVREEVDTFMFEGHDTTAWGLIWAIYLVGLDRRVQSKLQAEIDEVFESLEHPNQLTLDVLKNRLQYTEAVMKEAQRLFPSVPLIARCVESKITIGQYTIPRGCQLFISPRAVHRDPNHWKEGERFIPERFLADRQFGQQSEKGGDQMDNNQSTVTGDNGSEPGKRRHPYAYIPFSAGVRNCIGMKFAILEAKAVLAFVFRHFQVTSLDQREHVQAILSVITKTSVPIRVKIEERRPSHS